MAKQEKKSQQNNDDNKNTRKWRENPDKVEGNSHAGKWQKVNK